MTDIVDHAKVLVEEMDRLERALNMNVRVGDKPPGQSQVANIKTRIAVIKREIAKMDGALGQRRPVEVARDD